MPQRLNYFGAAPEGLKAMMDLERYLAASSIDHTLRHLVKLRASQINGCAYCIDMHWKDARAAGETEQRLYGLDAWRESPTYYTPREMAALAWTEALTKITEGHASDAVFEQVRPHFNDRELADLSLVISTINAWNRLAIGFRAEPGKYKPGMHK
jgi:AhpD family alkylhydroperoxidase